MPEPRSLQGDLAAAAFVQSSLLFKSLDPEAMADLLSVAALVDYEPAERMGGPADEAIWLVRDGTAVLRGAAGSTDLAVLEKGAVAGEGAALGLTHDGELWARTAVSAVVLPAAVVRAMADRFPKVRKLLEAVHAAREKGHHG